MYTDGKIWEKMLELKVFRIEDIIKALNPPKPLYGWVKEKVRSLIASQLRLNILRQVVENPPLFATEDATPEDIEKYKKTCPICNSQFFPKQETQEFCSAECKKNHYKNYHRRRRKAMGMRLDSRRRWTTAELKALEPLLRRNAKKGELENIAKQLSRSKWAVEKKLKTLRKEVKHATTNGN